ncbi:MAG TPA: ankyrin repeat domain-containing protein [Gemmatimonadaceae bacterium]|nr:ankyrin repeat domain-containing protein [Gemmatimonadaceae bacterium]
MPSPSFLPARPSFEQLRKQAKELLRDIRSGNRDALKRLRAYITRATRNPQLAPPTLADAQFVLAREYGFESWAKLKRHVETVERPRDFDEAIWGHDTWPFLVAVYEGRDTAVRDMLDRDPTLARAEYAYMQPLHYAVRGGREDMVRLLIDAGADPLAEGWSGRIGDDTPLARARDRERPDVVALLEAAVKHPRAPAPERNVRRTDAWRELENEMFKRSGSGDIAGALEMIRAHPGIAQAGLYEAVHHDEPEMARLLLDHGADPTIPWRWACWYTPLMHSLRYSQPRYETAQLLLDGGVKLDDTNGLGMATLHILANEGTPAAAAWLIDRGADLHMRDREFESTPLAWAARAGREDMVKFLLARGAKPVMPDDESWNTPFAWARRRGHVEVARLLAGNKPDLPSRGTISKL